MTAQADYALCPACSTERVAESFVGGVCNFCHDAGKGVPQPEEPEPKRTRKPSRKVGLAAPAPVPPVTDAVGASAEPYQAPQFDAVAAAASPQAELAARVLSRRHLLSFVKRFRPKYDAGWVHIDICRRLERFLRAVENGEEPRLLLMMPPRSGKSELASRHFAPWILGKHPDWEIIAASHTTSLSMSFSRYIRDLLRDPAYHAVFPNAILDPQSQSTENWNLTGGGGYLAAGVGSAITGRGAHCFPAGTLVRVGSECVRIEHLSPKQKVLSYDHSTCTLQHNEVRAVQVSLRDDLYEIVTTAGRRVVATGDHPFYVPGAGYTEARLLSAGSELLIAAVPALRSEERGLGEALPGVLLRGAGGNSPAAVRSVLGRIRTAAVRAREVTSAWARGFLLLQSMQRSAPRGEKREEVRALRSARSLEGSLSQREILLAGMPPGGAAQTAGNVPSLRRVVRAAQRAAQALLAGLRRRRAFPEYAGRGEFSLQGRSELHAVVLAGAEAGIEPGQGLRGLRSDRAVGGASHQPSPAGQPCGEPGNAVPDVPCGAPQVTHDAVAVVRRLRSGRVPVYDIQVEGTSNFFAGEILVHNCLILDDLVKDIESADSKTQCEATWEWYISTAHSRLAPGGGVLGIMTWWSEADWAGRIQQVMKKSGDDDEMGGEIFEIVRYPAINELGDEYILADDSIVEIPPEAPVPPGATLTRPKGTALHPARYTTAAMLRKKANYIAAGLKRMWDALYQQNPTPDEGIYFGKEMFRYYVHTPDVRGRFIYQAWDFAITEKSQSDWTVGTTLLQDEYDNLYVLDVLRFRSDDGNEIIETVLDYQQQWGAQLLGFEDGQIWKALTSQFKKRCEERKIYPAHELLVPLTDKMVRANPLKGRMQMGKVYFPKNASWFATQQTEMLRFPAGKHDDQVDSLAWCVRLTLTKSAPKMPEAKKLASWKDKLKALGGDKGGAMAA